MNTQGKFPDSFVLSPINERQRNNYLRQFTIYQIS
ncbi:hypothetical protein CtesDRAFT_PD2004 [Comamonas testosteroni KF-1]|uniref:Uncharacterized protein n=1 Tax=Comamonas testosteroni (strain DSM 14576 / KF-1) TaxID=399795 RepID=B7WQR3_COMTK|nr:hypothetical protein CtesDRAFT_PD2004 [Comamonas testosteroni KF-1]